MTCELLFYIYTYIVIPKSLGPLIFVRYSHEFIITVIVLNEFGCAVVFTYYIY